MYFWPKNWEIFTNRPEKVTKKKYFLLMSKSHKVLGSRARLLHFSALLPLKAVESSSPLPLPPLKDVGK